MRRAYSRYAFLVNYMNMMSFKFIAETIVTFTVTLHPQLQFLLRYRNTWSAQGVQLPTSKRASVRAQCLLSQLQEMALEALAKSHIAL